MKYNNYMNIETVVVGVLQTNCYIVHNNKEAIIIDPGSDAPKIINIIAQKKLKPNLIVNTHYHFDHTGVNKYIKEAFDIPIAIGKKDAPFLEKAYIDGLMFMIDTKPSPKADILLNENDKITIGEDIELFVLETPGHSMGSICLLNKHEHVIFSGDTLFFESVGRFDLPNSSESHLKQSLQKLLFLDDDYVVYPGHGPTTTIQHEKYYNPFI